MRYVTYLLLSWFFYAHTTSGEILTVGPFRTEQQCEQVRVTIVESLKGGGLAPTRAHIEPMCWVLV